MFNNKRYLKGKGLNLSDKINLEGNNLFSLNEFYKKESLNFICIKDISETKFYRIILKEILDCCKVGGHLLIQYGEKDKLNYLELKKEIILCYEKKAKIIEESDKMIILKKIKKSLKKEDNIKKWTFGIITNGKKNEWVERQIASIRNQKIPEYEIIICGKYYDRKEKDVKYIYFDKKDDLGWITKKKNLICNSAKYENICVLHDRIILKENWFEGMKKYGNYFEVLSCIIKNEEGERAGDWITYGNTLNKFPSIGILEYKDWDKYGYLDGAMYILKKSVWKKVKWDEKLFWNQGEDIKLSQDWYNAGIVTRFNPFSECITLNWRHGKLPLYQFNKYKLGKYPIPFYKRDSQLIKFYAKKLLWKSH